MTVEYGPDAGEVTVRIRRTVWSRVLEGLSFAALLFVMAAVLESLRQGWAFDVGFWLSVSAVAGLYSFAASGSDVLRATREYAQVDRTYESVLVDRSQQDAPYYDSDSDSLRFGYPPNGVRFGKGVGSAGADVVRMALGHAGPASEPPGEPHRGLELLAHSAGKLLIGAAAVALLVLGASKSVSYAVLFLALMVSEVVASGWRRRHPRRIKVGGSG